MFNIKIYLDDNSDGEYLSKFLEKEGFEVISPRNIGLNGKNDEEHLKCAIVNIIKKAKNDSVDLRIISVLQEPNINYYKEFGKFLENLDVKYWFIQEITGKNSLDKNFKETLKNEFLILI